MKYIKLVRLCPIECTWPLRSPTPLPSNPLIGWILFWNSSLKFATDSLMFPIDRDSCVTFKPEAIRDTAVNLDSPDDR
jgi:hypothetical protein